MGLLQVDSIYGTVHSEEYPPFNCRTLVNPVWRIRTEDGPVLDCYPTLLQCTIAQRPHLRGSEDLSVEYSVHELPGVGKFTLLVNWPPEEWRANEFIAYRIPGRAIDIMAREGTTAGPHVNIGYSLCCSSHDALNEARVRLGLSSDPVLFGACSVCETELFTQCAICGRLIGRDGTCHAAFHSPREAHGIRFGADKIWKDFPRLHFTWEEVKNLVAKGGTSPVWAEVKTRETRASALAEEFRLMTPR
jgi:hypothetical protein